MTFVRTSPNVDAVTHMAQPQCRLGMAAYWFDTFSMAELSNDHSVGNCFSVSTKP